MTQPVPSGFSRSHPSTTDSSSPTRAWVTGIPEDRIDVGTLASGISARITGSASAMISAGVR